MFKVTFDITGVNKLCEKLKKELKSVKGARAGYIHDKRYPNGLSLVQNALIQEFGTEHIPPRPFLRNTIKRNEKKWANFLKEYFNANMDGHMTLKMIALNIALMMQGDIQKSILSNTPPPNKPSTIRQKGSSKTLIDTGLLLNSVQSEVITNKNKDKD